jgi:fructokinase
MKLASGDIDLVAIGETIVDLISVEETDCLLEATTFRKYQGGAPANVAAYVAKLGGKSALISKVGAGALGEFLATELQSAGVLTDHLLVDQQAHTSAILISRSAGTADSDALRSSDYLLEPDDVDPELIKRARVVHASTFALSREPCRSAVEKAFKLAQKYGKIISLDPNYNPVIWPDYQEAQRVVQRMMGYATITKSSTDDAARIFGPGKTHQEYIQLFHRMGPQVVVFTMGTGGALLSTEGEITHIPSRPVEVMDATGAGDSFWAGFLVALLDGNTLHRCALFAREVAERKLTIVGPWPGFIDRDEIYARLDALA